MPTLTTYTAAGLVPRCIRLLQDLGIHLPKDTSDPELFLERLYVALEAVVGRQEAEDAETPPMVEQPSGAFMSTLRAKRRVAGVDDEMLWHASRGRKGTRPRRPGAR